MPLLSTSSLSFFVPTLCPCCYTFFFVCFFPNSQWSSQVVICIIVLERQFLRGVTAISYTLSLFHRFSFTFQWSESDWNSCFGQSLCCSEWLCVCQHPRKDCPFLLHALALLLSATCTSFPFFLFFFAHSHVLFSPLVRLQSFSLTTLVLSINVRMQSTLSPGLWNWSVDHHTS